MKFRSWEEFRRKNKELGLELFSKKDLAELNLKPGPDTPCETHNIAYEGHYKEYVLYKNVNTLPIKRRQKHTVLHDITQENLCAALYQINKSAKVSRNTKVSAYNDQDYSQVSRSKTRQLSLYEIKDAVVKKMVDEGLLQCRGVHTQIDSNQHKKKNWLLYYVPSEEALPYSFHVPVSKTQSKHAEFLGEIDNIISAEKKEELLILNFDEAKLLLHTYLNGEKAFGEQSSVQF